MKAAYKSTRKQASPGKVFPITEFKERFASLEDHMRSVQAEIEELQTLTSKLLDVGVAISSEIDLYALLTRIIDEAKNLLKAERGTLYLVDQNTGELYFHVTDDAKIKQIRIPINRESISGNVAFTGKELNIDDVYKIAKSEPYTFNKAIDRKTGFRTRSMLTVPMRNHSGVITGVVQLINKTIGGETITFSQRDERILASLASQAAVAIENAQLYKEIADLFESFIIYSSSAIDERDPATAGHSRRVAMYSVATARAMGCFTDEQIRELRYASWLHDVGKIGVREHILVKENKLYPDQLGKVRERFIAIKLSTQAKFMARKLKLLGKSISQEILDDLDRQMAEEFDQLADDLSFIEETNKPGFLSPENLKRVERLARLRYHDAGGKSRPWLEPEEAHALKVVRGNLTEDERKIMNAHAKSTFNILSKIPFTGALREIPKIASSHHEKLDGSGYPAGLKSKSIPLQAKIIALVDIYDAVTAQDRPYKPAIPVDRALKIIQSDVDANRLDADVFRVFLDHKIYALKDDEATQESIFTGKTAKDVKKHGK